MVSLVLVVFLVLCGGCGLSRAQHQVYTAAEGGNITVRCLFHSSGNWKAFCKSDCNKTANILVETLMSRRAVGRYSIKYETNASSPGVISVSVSNMSQADSGLYSCVLGDWRGWMKTQRESVKFRIQVSSVISSDSRPLVWLLLAPVAITMTAVLLFLICRKKRAQKDENNTRKSQGNTTEMIYENSPAAECTYQSLCVDTMDPEQIYSTIRDHS